MKIADIPVNENDRLKALHSLHILDTSPEERFDRLTRLARRLFDVPIAVVSLIDVDRQWFKSCVGLDVDGTSRDIAFCAHAILSDDLTVIDDALADDRFSDNPLVTGAPYIRFYAGCPIRSDSGHALGTLCLIDPQPRSLDQDERVLLKDLGAMVEQELASTREATIDIVTGLSNRRGFDALASQALGQCTRMGQAACMLYFDVLAGAGDGDALLSGFGALLASNFRQSDVIGRLDQQGFGVLLSNVVPADVKAMLHAFEQALRQSGRGELRPVEWQYRVGVLAFDPARHGEIGALIQGVMARAVEPRTQDRAAPR